MSIDRRLLSLATAAAALATTAFADTWLLHPWDWLVRAGWIGAFGVVLVWGLVRGRERADGR